MTVPGEFSTRAGAAPPIAHGLKILIAEDDLSVAKALQLTLERKGHEVVVTQNGTEAWEAFDRDPVRIVISDCLMPGLDGLEFCRRVRARPKTPYTYFILITALSASPENCDLGADAGIDDFFTKPLDVETIRRRLRVAERIVWFAREAHQLKQVIPICCQCHKIDAGEASWQRLETYIKQQTGSRFSHGMCPQCVEVELSKLNAEPAAPAV